MSVFDLRNAVYYRGGPDRHETVRIDILMHFRTYKTTMLCPVALLEAGVRTYACDNRDDIKLTNSQYLAVLRFVEEERVKCKGTGRKTLDGWRKSGLPTIEDYLDPGDTVDDELVDYFRNVLPPLCDRSSLFQAGGTHSTEQDDAGRWRPTFLTFSRSDGEWRYAGVCFPGEAVNRVTYKSPIQRQIAATEAALVARGGIAPAT